MLPNAAKSLIGMERSEMACCMHHFLLRIVIKHSCSKKCCMRQATSLTKHTIAEQ